MTWSHTKSTFSLLAVATALISGCSGNREAREVDAERVTPLASGPAPVERVVPREIVTFEEESATENTVTAREQPPVVSRSSTPDSAEATPRSTAPQSSSTSVQKKLYVDASSLNVRASADTNARVQTRLPRNAIVTVMEEAEGTDGNGWSRVSYLDGTRYRTGWVATNYLSATRSTPPVATSTPTRRAQSSPAGPRLQKSTFHKPEGEYFEQFERLNYTPVPKPSYPGNPKIEAKAVYVSLAVLSSPRFDEILKMVETTELNALVIDFKDDVGWLLTKSPTAAKLVPEADRKAKYDDISGLIQRLKARNIYLIARIVTFKDPMYSRAHPESAIINRATNKPYKSGDGLAWSSPYDPGFRAYNIGIAKEAAQAGFNEIQFDYVRFPDVPRTANLDYRDRTGKIKADAIQSFLIDARAALAPHNVYVAADVFAWITTAVDDVRIGQYWEAISNVVDYICPMMYPSHYHKDAYGLRDPNAQPYELIRAGLNDAQLRDKSLNPPATIRPWLQGFSYTPAQVKAQIRAARELGVNTYLIWHPSGTYNAAAYR